MSQLTALDLMTRDVVIAKEDWSLEHLMEVLLSRCISGAPVVNEGGKLVGVVSVTDLIRSRAAGGDAEQGEDMHDFYVQALQSQIGPEDARSMGVDVESDRTVRDIMTPVVFDVAPDASPKDIAEAMLTGRIHRVFVTDHGSIVGVITTFDMLRVIRDM